MAPRPPRHTHRFCPAKGLDVPAIRAFFLRLLDGGDEQFNALQPYTYVRPFGIQPPYDVWISRHKGEVVAAGWYHLRDDGRVRVVALSDPRHDRLTDTLLAHLEAGLQVIARDGRYQITELTAWLPEGEPRARLERAYLQRGWTFVERPWTAWLHRASLRQDALLAVIVQAQDAGIELHPQSIGDIERAGPHTTRRGPLHSPDSAAPVWQATEHGRVVAVSGAQFVPGSGTVVSMLPTWVGESAQPDLVRRALLAAVLLGDSRLPDQLTGTGELSALNDWFEGTIEVQVRDGYTLTIDPTREPLPWEFALGFNPDRMWLDLPE